MHLLFYLGDIMVITLKLKNIVALFLVFSLILTTIFYAIADDNGVEVPVIMYHSVLKDTKYHGKFVVSPYELEEDFKWLKENGYTTVFMSDLINYVEKGTPLPQKPIVLTFDDGYYNNYIYAYPLARKYNMKLVISVVGKYTDQYTKSGERSAYYSHLTQDDIKEMHNSGLVEFANHSYDMHTITKDRNGSKKNKNETEEHYKNILVEDITKNQKLIKEATGQDSLTYTYPFGSVSYASFDILKGMGFKATLSCSEGTNHITDNLYMLKRFIRPNGKSVKNIL